MKIDYKNRALMMARAYSPEGTSDVELLYDRFDKVLYFTDLNTGAYYLANGSPYNPSPIPDGNKLLYTSLYNGIVGMKFAFPVQPSSIIPENWDVKGGKIYFANQLESDTLILFTMDNYDTLLITAEFENMVGDFTRTRSIASLPGIYKSFETQEQLCDYYGEFGQTIPEPDGQIFIDYTQSKSYLDDQGRGGIDKLNGKWIYIITTSVPEDTEGTMYAQQYLYAYVDGQMAPNQSILTMCSPVVLTFQALDMVFEDLSAACTYYNDNAGSIEWDTTMYLKDDNTWAINDRFEAAQNGVYIINWVYEGVETTRLMTISEQISQGTEVASTYCAE